MIFLAEAGEEGTTDVGIDFLVQKHWDKIACEFALNEGGSIRQAQGKVHYVGVSTAEKVPRPLLLMGHLDVVGVEREKWTVDPFGGVVRDGYLTGRGAMDDKAMTAACLGER